MMKTIGLALLGAAACVLAADFEIPAQVRQGEAVRILVRQAPADALTAEFLGKRVRLFPQPDGTQLALTAAGALEKPRAAELTIRDAAGRVLHTATLTITNAAYRVRNLQPTKSMQTLKPTPGEVDTMNKLLATVTPERHWQEPFHPPTGDCISSPFGVQTWYFGKPSGAYHRGIDLFSGAGTPVKAIADGHVRIAQMWNMQGGTIGIDHGQGVISTYLHQSKLLVTEGQFVKKGETVGLVGSTGFSTGPHLHWALALNGTPINGATWMAAMRPCGGAPVAKPASKRPAAKKRAAPVRKKAA